MSASLSVSIVLLDVQPGRDFEENVEEIFFKVS